MTGGGIAAEKEEDLETEDPDPETRREIEDRRMMIVERMVTIMMPRPSLWPSQRSEKIPRVVRMERRQMENMILTRRIRMMTRLS